MRTSSNLKIKTYPPVVIAPLLRTSFRARAQGLIISLKLRSRIKSQKKEVPTGILE
jgi:hypothetical protein